MHVVCLLSDGMEHSGHQKHSLPRSRLLVCLLFCHPQNIIIRMKALKCSVGMSSVLLQTMALLEAPTRSPKAFLRPNAAEQHRERDWVRLGVCGKLGRH